MTFHQFAVKSVYNIGTYFLPVAIFLTRDGKVEGLDAHLVHMIFVEAAENESDGVIVSHGQRFELARPRLSVFNVKAFDVLQVLQNDPIELDGGGGENLGEGRWGEGDIDQRVGRRRRRENENKGRERKVKKSIVRPNKRKKKQGRIHGTRCA